MSTALDKQIGGGHYKDMKIQPIEFITENNFDWYQGNVIKYLSRHKFKNGREDVEKVIHYCEMLLEKQYPQRLRKKKKVCRKKRGAIGGRI